MLSNFGLTSNRTHTRSILKSHAWFQTKLHSMALIDILHGIMLKNGTNYSNTPTAIIVEILNCAHAAYIFIERGVRSNKLIEDPICSHSNQGYQWGSSRDHLISHWIWLQTKLCWAKLNLICPTLQIRALIIDKRYNLLTLHKRTILNRYWIAIDNFWGVKWSPRGQEQSILYCFQ